MAPYREEDWTDAQLKLQDESEDLAVYVRLYRSATESIETRKSLLYGEGTEVNYSGVPIWLKAIINDSFTVEQREKYGIEDETRVMFFINKREFDPYNIHPIYVDSVSVDDLIFWDNKYFEVTTVSENKIFRGNQPVIVAQCVEKIN